MYSTKANMQHTIFMFYRSKASKHHNCCQQWPSVLLRQTVHCEIVNFMRVLKHTKDPFEIAIQNYCQSTIAIINKMFDFFNAFYFNVEI